MVAMPVPAPQRSVFAFLGAILLAASLAIIARGPASRDILGLLTAIVGAAVIFVVCVRLTLGVQAKAARQVWYLVVVLLAVACVCQLADWLLSSLSRAPSVESVAQWAVLGAVSCILWVAARPDPAPARVRKLLRFALFCQVASIAIDVVLGTLITRVDGARWILAHDLLDLLSVQLCLLAVATFVTSLRWEKFKRNRQPSDIGDFSRYLFVARKQLRKRYRYPTIGGFALPGGKIALGCLRFAVWYFPMAPIIRRNFGRSMWQQFCDIFAIAVCHGLDPQAYYMFELYRPHQRQRAAGYLTRYETKNGVLKLLTTQVPKVGHRTFVGDKLTIGQICEERGIPHVPNLIVATKGVVQILRDRPGDIEQDLFVKPRYLKGASGAELIEYRAGQYKLANNVSLTREQFLELLAARSHKVDILVQPRIRNHPSLIGLADRSLIPIRVFTCLNDADEPVVTHGMLRVLSKLEPEWPTRLEFGSPVDLATGVLGLMTGDKAEMALGWYENHPVTGSPVLGRTVPCWKDVCAVAKSAHRACIDRLIIGWDIAIAPDGPIIVEGNAYPDVDFLQRVHRQSIGDSPLGPLLMAHLIEVDRRIETGTLKRWSKPS